MDAGFFYVLIVVLIINFNNKKIQEWGWCEAVGGNDGCLESGKSTTLILGEEVRFRFQL